LGIKGRGTILNPSGRRELLNINHDSWLTVGLAKKSR